MDKFAIYHSIKSAQSIVSQYPAAADIAAELANLARQLSSRTYRVAVIGEFKRGKSSLVNCILGTEILPTDILPTTAVVNRIVYGTEKKIEIRYKDGTVKNATVSELAEYATKKNDTNAALIREIVVHYPALFCQNNVELLDTPGLNDDEFMDRTTLDVLDKIDTALVVTHASYPVSETEKNLICRLIEQEDIYHLTFVATFIDRVADDPEEQDEIVTLIHHRLSKETYQLFCRKHPDEPKLLEKAKRILCDPVVFAVSSRLAMRSFVSGDKQMLDESRFPHFKYELSALLTANQELDLQMKASRLIHVANENFPSWHQQLLSKLDTDLARAKTQLQAAQVYHKSGCVGLVDQFMAVDQALEDGNVFCQDPAAFENALIVRRCARLILCSLLQIDPEQASAAGIEKALAETGAALLPALDADVERTKELVLRQLQQVNDYLLAAEKKCGMDDGRLTGRLAEWNAATPFPRLDAGALDPVKIFESNTAKEKLQAEDVVALAKWVHAVLCNRLHSTYSDFQKQLHSYIASWRSQLLKQNQDDKARMAALAETAAEQIRNIRQQKDAAVVNCNTNQNTLARTAEEISAVLP